MTARYSRRQVVLGGAGAVAVGAGLGVGVDRWVSPRDEELHDETPAGAVQTGDHQPGVHLPHTPAAHQLVTVLTWPDDATPGRDALAPLLAGLGEEILAVVGSGPSALLPDGPGDLTVQVGLGPSLVAAVDDSLPGASGLPAFVGSDDLDPQARSGDLVLLVAATDPTGLGFVTERLTELLPGATVAWQQQGIRPPGRGPVARNPLGHLDGIIVPRDDDALDRGVWIGSGPAAGGTVGVIRRFELDVVGFRTLPIDEQEAVIGRRKIDGAPLSGGAPDAEVNLLAKSPSGDFLTPARSHARAAHPSFTGSPLMMRRSYGFTGTDPERGDATSGLLFISYQNDLDVFVRTQRRLDATDDLMTYATVTAEISFLVLPGFDADRPLGSSLFA